MICGNQRENKLKVFSLKSCDNTSHIVLSAQAAGAITFFQQQKKVIKKCRDYSTRLPTNALLMKQKELSRQRTLWNLVPKSLQVLSRDQTAFCFYINFSKWGPSCVTDVDVYYCYFLVNFGNHHPKNFMPKPRITMVIPAMRWKYFSL